MILQDVEFIQTVTQEGPPLRPFRWRVPDEDLDRMRAPGTQIPGSCINSFLQACLSETKSAFVCLDTYASERFRTLGMDERWATGEVSPLYTLTNQLWNPMVQTSPFTFIPVHIPE